MDEAVGDLGIKRFVLVADRGMYSGTNMHAVCKAGNDNMSMSFMEFLQKLRENPGSYRISSAHSKGLRRFLKKEYVDKVTGEKVNLADLMPMIDEAKLTEFNELMGYYQIVTSELEMGDREVIEKYHGLTQIEDQFREMKATANPF